MKNAGLSKLTVAHPSGGPVAGEGDATSKIIVYVQMIFITFLVGSQKRGIVSGGTEHTVIWPSDFAVLYTIVSLEEASLQDFAGSVPATGGSLPPPGPLLASSLLPFLSGSEALLSFRVDQRRHPELSDQIQVLLDQGERVARGLSDLCR